MSTTVHGLALKDSHPSHKQNTLNPFLKSPKVKPLQHQLKVQNDFLISAAQMSQISSSKLWARLGYDPPRGTICLCM